VVINPNIKLDRQSGERPKSGVRILKGLHDLAAASPPSNIQPIEEKFHIQNKYQRKPEFDKTMKADAPLFSPLVK